MLKIFEVVCSNCGVTFQMMTKDNEREPNTDLCLSCHESIRRKSRQKRAITRTSGTNWGTLFCGFKAELLEYIPRMRVVT